MTLARIIQALSLALLTLLMSGAAHAQEELNLQGLVLKEGTSSFNDLCDQVNKWSDYSCHTELNTFKPNKKVQSRCHFFYKDNQIRIEVEGGGYRDGTVLVKYKDGSVQAHGGMWLGGIMMKLDPDSRMLILPNGNNAVKCTFAELLSALKSDLGKGYTVKVSAAPIDVAGLKKKARIFELYEPPASPAKIYRRIYLGADDARPMRWEHFTDGKLSSTATFNDLHVNSGLADSLFKL